MKAISVEELSKTFSGGTVAVDEIGFSLNQGEIFGFLGPNGAGKTTIMAQLSRQKFDIFIMYEVMNKLLFDITWKNGIIKYIKYRYL